MESRNLGLNVVRYGLGGALVIAGIVMIAVNPSGLGGKGVLPGGAELPPDAGIPKIIGNRERAAEFVRAIARNR